ncbi:MAG: hypothetical protein ABL971_07795 [Vicinamibacterales bacterium]
MTFTRTSVALIAAGSLALGVGGAWLLTRPSGEPVPSATETQAAVQPAIESAAPAPAAAADPAPAAAPAPSPARIGATEPRRPASQASRPAATQQGTTGRVPDVKAPTPVEETRPAAAPATRAVAAPAPQPTPERLFEELVVSASTVLSLRIDAAVSSESASVEDRVTATVTRDIRVGDRVAIPSGSIAHGEVTLVERGGKVKDRSRLGVRFTSIALGNGTRVPIESAVIVREGASATKESTAKIGGGAIGGAIVGGIIGGKKGAAIGSTVGAGAGTAAVMAGGRNAATLEPGEAVSLPLTKPAAVTVDR